MWRWLNLAIVGGMILVGPAGDWISPRAEAQWQAAGPTAVPAPEPMAHPAPLPAPIAVASSDERPTTEVLALLKRVEARHGHLKTLVVTFEQVRRSEQFFEETRSNGTLYVQMPDRLRCDYSGPEPTTIWFVGNAFYQYIPAYKQVDKFSYEDPAEARERLRLTMLGFGLSAQEVLESYHVEPGAWNRDEKGALESLVFRPRRPEMAKMYSQIRVWFDAERLLPTKVRMDEVSGDVTVLTIRDLKVDAAVDPKKFEMAFPADVDINEY